MPNRSRFPLTGPPHREDAVFVLGAVLLLMALFVLVSGPMLLSRIGGGVQLPVIISSAAPEARVAIFTGTEQTTDERIIAQPEVPAP